MKLLMYKKMSIMCKTFTKNYILKFQINNEIILREENQKKYQND